MARDLRLLVMTHPNSQCVCCCRNPPPLGRATRPGRVEVADVDRPGVHELETAGCRVLALARAQRHTRPRADVADHIDHIRKVAGIDHVGIGSDFDGIPETPAGLEGVDKFPALLTELARRGYRDQELAKVAGGNLLRVLGRAQEVSARLRAARGPSGATLAGLDGPASAKH